MSKTVIGTSIHLLHSCLVLCSAVLALLCLCFAATPTHGPRNNVLLLVAVLLATLGEAVYLLRVRRKRAGIPDHVGAAIGAALLIVVIAGLILIRSAATMT